jgi:hypothetical protein
VPIQRSAIALARGARIGVPMMRVSAPAKIVSKVAVNLLSRSRIKNRNWAPRSSRLMSRLRACWATQAPGGAGGDPDDVHASADVLDHDEDVEAAQKDSLMPGFGPTVSVRQ